MVPLKGTWTSHGRNVVLDKQSSMEEDEHINQGYSERQACVCACVYREREVETEIAVFKESAHMSMEATKSKLCKTDQPTFMSWCCISDPKAVCCQNSLLLRGLQSFSY